MFKKKINKKFNKKNKFIKKNKIFKKKKNNIIKKKKYLIIKKNKKQNKKNKNKKNKIDKKYINKLIKNIKCKNKYIRPPIITIMGHVNHGKTSLIDYLKSTNIVKEEKGNITQYINSYYIKNKYQNFTIIDTPGHEIFENMRIKGLIISDIIILMISIDDGITPQTIKIIKYIKKYKKPTIITISKIDKINYKNNINIIKKNISKYGFIPKEWGGNDTFIEISTKLNLGINKLIKYISKISKKINLKTYLNKEISYGIILESFIDSKKGIISNIIAKNGILNKGDTIICKNSYGKIKCIYDENNNKIKKVLPSIPVKILGLNNIKNINKKFISIKNNKIAKKIININKKINKYKINNNNNNKNEKNENIFINKKKINIIIKSDVYNSKETLINWIKNNFNNKIKIIYSGIGNINKNDISLAKTSKSIIIGYNIKIENTIKKKINKKIKIYFFEIIYKLINKIKKIIEKKYKKYNSKILGKAIITNIFKNKFNIIAGCKITEGFINKINNINIIRKDKIIYNGKIKSIKQFKKNINIVKKNTECGIIIKNFTNIKIGDIINSIK